MTQTFSSARTSIRQVSKPYKIHLDKFGFEKGATILDFGGGRFDDAKNFMQKYDVKVMVYDPYNRSNDIIFSVYEGNGTGHDRQTGPDQYGMIYARR